MPCQERRVHGQTKPPFSPSRNAKPSLGRATGKELGCSPPRPSPPYRYPQHPPPSRAEDATASAKRPRGRAPVWHGSPRPHASHQKSVCVLIYIYKRDRSYAWEEGETQFANKSAGGKKISMTSPHHPLPTIFFFFLLKKKKRRLRRAALTIAFTIPAQGIAYCTSFKYFLI